MRNHWDRNTGHNSTQQVAVSGLSPVWVSQGGASKQPNQAALVHTMLRQRVPSVAWPWPLCRITLATPKQHWCCYTTPKGLRVTGLASAAAEMRRRGGDDLWLALCFFGLVSQPQLHCLAGVATWFQLRAAILKAAEALRVQARGIWGTVCSKTLQDDEPPGNSYKQLLPVQQDVLIKYTLMHLITKLAITQYYINI